MKTIHVFIFGLCLVGFIIVGAIALRCKHLPEVIAGGILASVVIAVGIFGLYFGEIPEETYEDPNEDWWEPPKEDYY